jgi:hypothetical protein
LSADGEPLQESQDDENDWREDARHVVRRQQRDQCRRNAHEQQRCSERALASQPIAHVTEHDGTERSRDEPDGERAE